jgi:DNA-binding response OmpR family regulator
MPKQAQKTVLLVDDSPTELKAMVSAMHGKGYRVITAADGEDALRKAVSMQPDVILLDIVLPKKNGFQVCRQLKTVAETKEIKIVLVSSKGQETDRFWGLRQGADDYLTKPYKADQIVRAVTQYA